MKAKQMISGASYGPEALKAIGQAFDEACGLLGCRKAAKLSSFPAGVSGDNVLLADRQGLWAGPGSRSFQNLSVSQSRALGLVQPMPTTRLIAISAANNNCTNQRICVPRDVRLGTHPYRGPYD